MTVAHIQVSFQGQTQGDMQNNTFTGDKFCSVSDVHLLLAAAKNNEERKPEPDPQVSLLGVIPTSPHLCHPRPWGAVNLGWFMSTAV